MNETSAPEGDVFAPVDFDARRDPRGHRHCHGDSERGRTPTRPTTTPIGSPAEGISDRPWPQTMRISALFLTILSDRIPMRWECERVVKVCRRPSRGFESVPLLHGIKATLKTRDIC